MCSKALKLKLPMKVNCLENMITFNQFVDQIRTSLLGKHRLKKPVNIKPALTTLVELISEDKHSSMYKRAPVPSVR